MWKFVQTTQFKKDYKKYANNKKKLLALQSVLSHLSETGMVPENTGHILCPAITEAHLNVILRMTSC